jgi:hypothetical protein
MTPARFPHSDTPGSTLGCQLPRAYRRLLRPSSALDAKASTTCPSQLVTHTTNPTPTTTPPAHPTQGGKPTRPRPGPGSQCTQKHDTPQRNQHTPANQTRTCQQTTRPKPNNTKTTGSDRNKSIQTIRTNKTDSPHHTPTKKQGATGRSRQMLASTIQISNNNPTPTTPTRHTITQSCGRQAGSTPSNRCAESTQ